MKNSKKSRRNKLLKRKMEQKRRSLRRPGLLQQRKNLLKRQNKTSNVKYL